MYKMTVMLILLVSLFSISSAYTDVDDTINYDELVKNPVELRAFMNCLLDKGTCKGTLQLDKAHMFEAVNDGCRECTPLQKHDGYVLFRAFKEHLPDLLGEFKARYDVDGKHLDTDIEKLRKYEDKQA